MDNEIMEIFSNIEQDNILNINFDDFEEQNSSPPKNWIFEDETFSKHNINNFLSEINDDNLHTMVNNLFEDLPPIQNQVDLGIENELNKIYQKKRYIDI